MGNLVVFRKSTMMLACRCLAMRDLERHSLSMGD
jgi:hypothetical protein